MSFLSELIIPSRWRQSFLCPFMPSHLLHSLLPLWSELVSLAFPVKELEELVNQVPGLMLATLLKMQNTCKDLKQLSPKTIHPSSQSKPSASFSNLQTSRANEFECLEENYFQMSNECRGWKLTWRAAQAEF